jgi:hypothetical protein
VTTGFHDDKDPSLHLYADGTWACFGCQPRRGGTIYDFAAYLWGSETKGRAFIELRRRLAELLLPLRPVSKMTRSFQS